MRDKRMNRKLIIPQIIVESIRAQAGEEKPNEACGYLMGKDDTASIFHKMTNVDGSPEHFTFDPSEQFSALEIARSNNIDLICVYHSHPNTKARMSEEDIRLAYDTSVVYVIYSIIDDAIKAFIIDDEKTVTEVELQIIDEVAAL